MNYMVWNVLYVLLFFAAWNYVYTPWREFRDIRRERVKEGQIYIKNHCVDKADLRVQIGDLDLCKQAEKRVASSPKFDAWEDLMQSWNIFPKNGLFGSTNIFEMTGYAAGALVALWFGGLLINVYMSFSTAFNKLVSSSTLPTGMKND